jgi:mono/diheme cytochrome c family protein
MDQTVGSRALVLGPLLAVAVATAGLGGRHIPLGLPAPNASGVAETLVAGRAVALDEPFFRSLGTNGRACVTCHAPAAGWSIEPGEVRRRFEITGGRDPLFRPIDGATSPEADVSTVAARREAYALLLARGVIRVGLPLPPGAEFELLDVDDPYGYASAAELSLFRRPLPSTNLAFLSTVMWDGRESAVGRTIRDDLMVQSNDATVGHAQAAPIDETTRRRIVDFELRLTTAQAHDRAAGRLTAERAAGGPRALATQPFWPGINSPSDPTQQPVTTDVFTIFSSWAAAVGRGSADRQAVARGQALFNGLTLGNGRTACSGCHNAPNAGSSSTGAFFDVGVAGELRRPPELPLYTLRCLAGPQAGRLVRTTDPGRALVTGRCADIARFKVPTLRALAARAPYFHDGSAATLEEVLDHYERQLGLGLVGAERADLAAFLRAL